MRERDPEEADTGRLERSEGVNGIDVGRLKARRYIEYRKTNTVIIVERKGLRLKH